MAIFDLYSSRNTVLPDVFTYDLPDKFRRQFVLVCEEDIKTGHLDFDLWELFAQAIKREHGLTSLPGVSVGRYGRLDWRKGCFEYVLNASTNEALDLIEMILRALDGTLREDEFFCANNPDPSETIDEVNHRLRAVGAGYRFEAGGITRVDSELIHAEVVKPALSLLASDGFEAANTEFLAAHEHWRHGRYEDAVVNACKAFESTLKVAMSAHGVDFDKTAPAGKLITAFLNGEIVPAYLRDHLTGLDKCLQGVATVRNKEAGHGAGEKPRDLPEHVAAYALHLAAANIVFVIESHLATRSK